MRRALIAKIKIAQKELGLDDATYRAVLERVTGKRSCTECSIPELERVVEDLRQHGLTAWNGCPTAICTSWWRLCRLVRTARKRRKRDEFELGDDRAGF